MRYNDTNPGTLPYLGAETKKLVVRLPMTIAAQLHELRMANKWSVRRLAEEISLITKDDARERAVAHGDKTELSGLRVSYTTINRVDEVGLALAHDMRVQGIMIDIRAYALICAYLGDIPHFAHPAQQAFYESKWLPVYETEKKRQGR